MKVHWSPKDDADAFTVAIDPSSSLRVQAFSVFGKKKKDFVDAAAW